ncbi:MAG: hypothetical protein ACW967_08375 [Candidatus Hodarchaeales archaeon]|jgi:hypothetical protein
MEDQTKVHGIVLAIIIFTVVTAEAQSIVTGSLYGQVYLNLARPELIEEELLQTKKPRPLKHSSI